MLSKLVKGLGVQADNAFSPVALRTAAANEARRLIIKRRRSEISFHSIIMRSRLAYGTPTCLPNVTISAQQKASSWEKSIVIKVYRFKQKWESVFTTPNLVANAKHQGWFQKVPSRLVTGFHCLLYEERLHRRRLRTGLVITLKIFTGLLDVEQHLIFLLSTRRGHRRFA